jgi:peroxiredoxin
MSTMAELSHAVRGKLQWFVPTLGAALLASNVLLAHQNRELKAAVRTPAKALELKPGVDVPVIAGADTEGNPLNFAYGEDARKTLVLVFSPTCRSCKENMPNWQALIKGINRESFRIVAVSLKVDGVAEYLNQYHMPDMPVVADLDARTRLAYNFALTPQTMLIDSEGKAEKVWTGVLSGRDKREVEEAMKVRLP